jgi:hypothetical protein
MDRIGVPFGTRRGGGLAVVWPAYTGPAESLRRAPRPPELWERRYEAFTGELVLEDPVRRRFDTTLVLARYLTLRVAAHAASDDWSAFLPEVERALALEYLGALPSRMPERRWLRAVLTSIDGAGLVVPGTVSRLSAAAAAASKRGHRCGAFALWRAAYELACRRGWEGAAGRVARAIARAAAAGRGRRAERLWSRRARVHELRAARD